MTNNEAMKEMGILPDYKDFPELRRGFEQRVRQRQEIKAKMEDWGKTLADLSEKIGMMLAQADAKSVACGKWRVTLVEGRSTSLSRERLLELGVAPATILSATKETLYTTVQVAELAKAKKGK